ncbi:MAG: ABC transporter ATP-binding protein/permease [Coprobacillus sp.]|nr:ABC transporter ATP-binding protein/permease [Coprobacillus sp.]
MLKLVDIKKDYIVKNQPVVNALKGINISFRPHEFVAVLGPSGCGKTTFLNIIGGLDHYTDGDLIIKGESTHDYTERDWDTYRNHSIGFVFQSYNLINHVSILRNVELALIIAGVSKKERRQRAYEILEKVGLKGYEKKKPNQLSGGQEQRVAIARALINNPEIILADEPTGALDSDTSVQIMDILKELSKSILVIMVTHNPELANEYATRVVKMNDGSLIDDSDPYDDSNETYEVTPDTQIYKGSKIRTSMSFGTALSLSFNNLWTKRTRTILITLAGSIGIIGITLVLSLTAGFNGFMDDVQMGALSAYPLTISKSSTDLSSLLSGSTSSSGGGGGGGDEEEVREGDVTEEGTFSYIVTLFGRAHVTSDTQMFKEFLELDSTMNKYGDDINAIQYTYGIGQEVYTTYGDEFARAYPYDLMRGDHSEYSTTQEAISRGYADYLEGVLDGVTIYEELIPNYDYKNYPNQDYNKIIDDNYEVVYGEMPKNYDEVVIVTSENDTLGDHQLIGMGLKTPQNLMEKFINSTSSSVVFDHVTPNHEFAMDYEDLCKTEFIIPMQYRLYDFVEDEDTGSEPEADTDDDYVEPLGGHYEKKSGEDLEDAVLHSEDTLTLKVSGIIKPKEGSTMSIISGAVGYLPSLTEYLIDMENNSGSVPGYETEKTNVILAQKNHPDIDVLTGNEDSDSAASNLKTFGAVDISDPESIYIYPKTFESKDNLDNMFADYETYLSERYDAEYGDEATVEGRLAYISEHMVVATDTVSSLLDSVETIVDAISYVLIAIIAISLVVSCVMIGVITYVSVLERSKEIGILRAMGARRMDISTVFNAETFIIGLLAGIIGVLLGLLIDLPIMFVINRFLSIGMRVILKWYWALLLPVISFVLTLISGLIPATIASRRDPAVVLRSE